MITAPRVEKVFDRREDFHQVVEEEAPWSLVFQDHNQYFFHFRSYSEQSNLNTLVMEQARQRSTDAEPPPPDYGSFSGVDSFGRTYKEAFNGQRPTGRNFGPNDFNNGCTGSQVQGGLGGLPPGWDAAFATFTNSRVPNAAEVLNLNAGQDRAFTNSQGNPVANPSGGRYSVLYVPSHNAMVVKSVESPSYLLARRQVPPADIPNLVPPLHRPSDLLWYTYSQNTPNPGNLRYIGHHFISNRDSSAIIDRLLQLAYNTNTPNIPWPGLRLDIDTDGAKALLATPNGVGVAYLMLDRAAVLGRRHPVVHIWNANGFRCMLWDMVPVGL
ncbi:MAG: hypothetical protein Q9213_001219 [Squamulea squamosa]